MSLLELRNLDVRYGRVAGTRALNLSIGEAETVALIGSNGAGKSSTLKAITGLVNGYGGDILWQGKSIKGMAASEVVKLGIGFSPEGRRVFPSLSVQENLKMGAFGRGGDRLAERMEQMFGYFPRLKERARQAAGSLSGGEQQMLAIGRALMSGPKLFLLDEPSLGLAPIIVERIGDILLDIQQREGLAFVLAEQNANWAMRVAQRTAILQLGEKVFDDESAALLEDPKVQTAFLGV
ncbi:ABC transporter ATP-binding protein [Bordetella genomosp. 8]|uniref:ABC transporter ATP-binding protein n=1 Tax=Bordetella genomosp. 8 TaxID=1416806 RepID=A0A1W6YEC7_9BORD|nr:ABC transporter ATP-binding protein [Bordetella genomosp. 8]ARP79417.1 ABC transporter ATP-binding protein [Bordetella genomosp. 8]